MATPEGGRNSEALAAPKVRNKIALHVRDATRAREKKRRATTPRCALAGEGAEKGPGPGGLGGGLPGCVAADKEEAGQAEEGRRSRKQRGQSNGGVAPPVVGRGMMLPNPEGGLVLVHKTNHNEGAEKDDPTHQERKEPPLEQVAADDIGVQREKLEAMCEKKVRAPPMIRACSVQPQTVSALPDSAGLSSNSAPSPL